MKKRFITVASFILIFVILSPITLSVSAEELYLGTEEDITGEIIPDAQNQTYGIGDTAEDQMPGDGYPTLFSITDNDITKLRTSNKWGKSFTKASLPTGTKRIICGINLNHTLLDSVGHSLDGAITAGVCYYGYNELYNEDTYKSVYTAYVPYEKIGVSYQTEFLIEEYLEPGVTYYSYFKNGYPAGYVYGTLTLYTSTTTG